MIPMPSAGEKHLVAFDDDPFTLGRQKGFFVMLSQSATSARYARQEFVQFPEVEAQKPEQRP